MPTLVEILNGERPANTSAVIVDTLPGLMFQYSGGGYAILQQLLVDVLQQPFPELMHDLVLEPLGMRLSTFDQPLPEDRHSNAATAHPYGARPLIDKWHVYPEMASQGLWSTPSEIALVAIELQRAVAGRSALGLSPELVDKTLTEPGLGLFIQGEGENKRFVHPGWGHGYMSEMVAYKHKGIGAVVMRNSSQGQMEFSAEVLRGIAQVYDWPDYLPVDLEIPSVNLNLSQYAGRYRLDSGDIAEVTVRGGALALSLLGQSPFELLPARDGTFFSKSLRGKTTFSADKEGAVTKIVFSTDWVYREAYRIS